MVNSFDIRVIGAILGILAGVTACTNNSSDRGGSGPVGSGGIQGTATASELTIEAPSVSEIFTKEAGENGCSLVVVTALADGKPTAGVKVTFALQPVAAMEDPGSVKPAEGLTGDDGKIEASYCSGSSEGRMVLVVRSGDLSKNTAVIRVTKKPVFAFTFVRSDLDPLLQNPAEEAASEEEEPLLLNLLDAGPQDCTTLYFKLTKSGQPVVAQNVRFQTQADFPKRAKLERRDKAGLTGTDAITGRKFAYYDAMSTGAGELAVPICAGVSLGTMVVSGTYTDEEGRSYTAQSPVVRILAGLTNWINFSLTFDPANSRTLRAYFNTNSEYDLPLRVELGSRQDGTPITDYPVIVASEVGRMTLENQGAPEEGKNSVGLTMHALHLVANYPFLVYPNNGANPPVYERVMRVGSTTYSQAQTRCHPAELAAWSNAKFGSTSVVRYSDLARNWRSTLVYAIRGQEHFNDANRNGVYDAGGNGFWDKNQNGIYDAGDVITFPAGGTTFDPASEWFIDMPTPFVDVDENGSFDSTVDILIGDEYLPPNGKRDSDTLIWKSEVFPISMGPSPYSLRRRQISASNHDDIEALVTLPASSLTGTYPIFGYRKDGSGYGLRQQDFWSNTNAATRAGQGAYDYIIFAHDICGNLLPGGTKFESSFVGTYQPQYGVRTPLGFFYMQEPDRYLEPARRLLREADGPSGTINFNAIDHVSKNDSYPVVGRIEIPPCFNACTGAVATDGVACDATAGYFRLRVTEPDLDNSGQFENVGLEVFMEYPSVQTCTCDNDASFNAGVCTCNGTRVQEGRDCVLPPT